VLNDLEIEMYIKLKFPKSCDRQCNGNFHLLMVQSN
jgi:hypothetical protein